MSAIEETVTNPRVGLPARERAGRSAVSRFMKLLCSVRFGIVLLVLLGLACLVGMLVMQENVDGFADYYASLTPAQRLVYGRLDFFDIYHSWYFNALLAVLSLNIVLASIDRFPKTWAQISKPVTTPPLRWLAGLPQTARATIAGDLDGAVEKVKAAYRQNGFKKISVGEKAGRTFVYAESGAWNRLGYLAVHVALLTIFTGGFLTTQLGQNGQLPLMPGETSDEMFETVFELDQIKEFKKRLPFEITCTDVEQKLIKTDGPITAGNTIDWLTRIRITDGAETHEALVQMNRPFDYRGYRFFQASFVPIGRAREITVELTPAAGGAVQEVKIPRDGSATLADGTEIKFAEFRGNFSIGRENPNEDTSHYPNPGAILKVAPAGAPGAAQTAYAFGPQMADIPVAKTPVAGYTYRLVDFEKAADRHVLAVQYDPGATVVYLGFLLLCLTLVAVFFFSHRRVWTALTENDAGGIDALVSGTANRNQTGFEDKIARIAGRLQGPDREA